MIHIAHNHPLQNENTFGFAVAAPQYTIINNEDDLLLNMHQHEAYKNGILVLGSGSNILFTKNPKQWILKNNIKGIEKIKEDNHHIWLAVKGGEIWHEFVMYCVAHNYAGVENLSLIPGTVGASPIQNIGAYGVEVCEVIESVRFYHFEDKQCYTFSNVECAFGYRDSVFKQHYKNLIFVTEVVFKLNKQPQFRLNYGNIKNQLAQMQIEILSIQAVSDAVIHIRQSKLPDPQKIGNAGSFFKNPVISQTLYQSLLKLLPEIPGYLTADSNYIKVPAAYLIEQAGWKGFKEHHVGVHNLQPLVLVHYGGGVGSEIFSLSERIIESVQNKYSILLEREVQIY